MQKMVLCKECGRIVEEDKPLRAFSPFRKDEIIIGCPYCYAIDSMFMVCDEPGCSGAACVGTPTVSGYRNTCAKHRIKI